MRVRVHGMTGQDGGRRVVRALEAAGAKEIQVDARRGRAVFTFDSEDSRQLTAAIEDAGYEPGRVATVAGDIPPRSPGGCCGGIVWESTPQENTRRNARE